MVKFGELIMILELHRQGLKVAAIARQLGVDRKTVRKYISRGLEPPAYALLPAPALTVRHVGFDHASTGQKVVAMTFDADMTPRMLSELKSGKVASWYNENVIATLRQQHVPANLFLTGLWIETYTAAPKELSDDPLFELGNHSYSHGGFRSPCYGLAAIRELNEASEVQRTDDLLKKYATSYEKYFRFPGLCFDAEDADLSSQCIIE